jgi:DNA adenine methylase
MAEILKAPFPWFGGKSRAARLVWSRFGNVANYVEPFAGSLAVLLGRQTSPKIETVNDRNCWISNFWRACVADPEGVAYHADWPVNQADLTARHQWLVTQPEWRERMLREPYFYDVRIAGWWVWGQSMWIGSGWCSELRSKAGRGMPDLGGDKGIHRNGVPQKIPYLSSEGMGVVPRQVPYLAGQAMPEGRILEKLKPLQRRLRNVRVCCGDWQGIMGYSVTTRHGVTGVFLDPPYTLEGRSGEVYGLEGEGEVAAGVTAWARENGADPGLRIALCGYEGDVDMPASWEKVQWKAVGGYGLRAEGQGRENAERERIWFSPACIRPQPGLFDALEALEPLPEDYTDEEIEAA